ncbi:hypothetical protein [Noviherbaspirillum pedocola]|uniref:Uncharacterized protein n=1 Tax=Noviherbaspirillum pedocola TaxID=2801341 RepID=A0A934SVJ4_9BURK|nr:hypothetical protein [Noviherbaspirillum pedocola]MBK4736384.1 hypothetical protein [Noviherbaspirillum pedocola]
MSSSVIQARSQIPAQSFADSIAPALNNEERLGFIGTRTLVQQSAPQPRAIFRPSRLSYIRSFFERHFENLTTLRTEARRSMHERHAIADLSRDIGEVIRFLMEKQGKFDPKKDARLWKKLQHSFEAASALCGYTSEKAKLFPEILAKHFSGLSAEQELNVRNALTKIKKDNELFCRSHGVVDHLENAVKSCVAQSMRKPLEYLFSAASNGDVNGDLLQDVVMELKVHGGFDISSEIKQQFDILWSQASVKAKFALLEASIGNDTVFGKCESMLASTLGMNPSKKNWWEEASQQIKLDLSRNLTEKLKMRQKQREADFNAKCKLPERLYDDELTELMKLGKDAYPKSPFTKKLADEYKKRSPIHAIKKPFMPDHAVRNALLFSCSENSFMRMYEGIFKLKSYVGKQQLMFPQSSPSEILKKLFDGFDPIEKINLTSDGCVRRLITLRAALLKEGGGHSNEFVKLLNCLFEVFEVDIESTSAQEQISPMAFRKAERVFKFLSGKQLKTKDSGDDGVNLDDFGKSWSASIQQRVGAIKSAPLDARKVEDTHKAFAQDVPRDLSIFFDGKPFLGSSGYSREAMISRAHKKILNITKNNYDQAGSLMMILNQAPSNSIQEVFIREPLLKLSSDKLKKPESMSVASPDESSLVPTKSDFVFNLSRLENGQVSVKFAMCNEELSQALEVIGGGIFNLDKNTSSFFLEAEFLVDESGNVSAPILGEYEFSGHITEREPEVGGYHRLRNASEKNKGPIKQVQTIED